jgi:RHS repeat-associated protein
LLAGKAEMTYGKDNRLDTYNGMKVEYNADGNQITGPLGESRESFKYDARNRLIQAGQTAYTYNSENNRISVTKGNSVTKYVVNPHAMLSQILMETDGNGKGQAWYVYGLGLIGREDSEGTYQTYHYDRRGSTVALTALSGEVTDRYVYGPYGELLRKTGDTKQPFLYNGRDGVVTDDNGLYYMRARYYNPDIKRFINRDVLTGSISVGQNLNRYAYVNGNPVSYVDPFGLSRDSDTSPYAHAANFVLDFIPFVGSIKGAFEAFTGVDVITGETLSASDRWAAGIGSVLGALPIPGAKQGGKYLTKGTIELEEQLEKSLVSAGTSKYRLPMDLQLFAGRGNRPPNLTPHGAGRRGAFREAKRNSGVPVTQQPEKVSPAVDRRGNRIPGRDYDFGNGKVIREHSGGHIFPDDPSQNRGPHFNDIYGNHYDYGN